MHLNILFCAILAAAPLIVVSFTSSPNHCTLIHKKYKHTVTTKCNLFGPVIKREGVEEERTYPESKPATYEIGKGGIAFAPEAIVKPLLIQTQLEKRKLQVVYNAKRDGWDARNVHEKVDGKGASVVLAKVRGQWIGGYNPRGWASLDRRR